MEPNNNQNPVGAPTPGQPAPQQTPPVPSGQPAGWPQAPLGTPRPQAPQPKKSLKNLPFPALMALALVLLAVFVIVSFTLLF